MTVEDDIYKILTTSFDWTRGGYVENNRQWQMNKIVEYIEKLVEAERLDAYNQGYKLGQDDADRNKENL